jgi:hypothetical protein
MKVKTTDGWVTTPLTTSVKIETEFAPAYGEIEVKITHTSSLSSYEDGAEIIPTPSMLMAVELEIERNQ